jgi:RNA polymerase sigma-70 factor (ECF subfamily)
MDDSAEAPSDEILMGRVATGDRAAFRELSRRHLPSVVALARHITGNAADAEDIAQDALLRVWTYAPRWQPLAKFRTWLTRVVINLCLDRKRRRTPLPLEAAGDPADNSPDAREQLEQSQRAQRITRAIDSLPERQRVAITLSYQQGLSNAEVAEILETTVSAVETLLVRAKRALRDMLTDKDD